MAERKVVPVRISEAGVEAVQAVLDEEKLDDRSAAIRLMLVWASMTLPPGWRAGDPVPRGTKPRATALEKRRT